MKYQTPKYKLLKQQKRESKRMDKEALEIAKLACKIRDEYKCAVCNRDLKDSPSSCNIHHILPNCKRFSHLRTHLNNLILLCPRCHRLGDFGAHHNTLYFAIWLEINRSEQYNFLLNQLGLAQELYKARNARNSPNSDYYLHYGEIIGEVPKASKMAENEGEGSC